jgi:hypothetical protein
MNQFFKSQNEKLIFEITQLKKENTLLRPFKEENTILQQHQVNFGLERKAFFNTIDAICQTNKEGLSADIDKTGLLNFDLLRQIKELNEKIEKGISEENVTQLHQQILDMRKANDEQVERFSNFNEKREEQIKKLDEEKKNLLIQNDKLILEIQTLKNQERQTKINEEVITKLSKDVIIMNEAKREQIKMQKEKEANQEEMEKMKRERELLKNELEAEREIINNMKNQTENNLNKISVLEREVNRLHNCSDIDAEELKKKKEELQDEFDGLKKAFRDDTNLHNIITKISLLTTEIFYLQSSLHQMNEKDKLEQQKQQIDRLKKLNMALRTERKDKKKMIDAFKEELETEKRNAVFLQQKIEEEIQNTKEKVSKTETEKEMLVTANQQLILHSESQNLKHVKMQKELDKTKVENQVLSMKIKSLEEENQSLKEKISPSSKIVEHLEKENTRLMNEIVSLRKAKYRESPDFWKHQYMKSIDEKKRIQKANHQLRSQRVSHSPNRVYSGKYSSESEEEFQPKIVFNRSVSDSI